MTVGLFKEPKGCFWEVGRSQATRRLQEGISRSQIETGGQRNDKTRQTQPPLPFVATEAMKGPASGRRR